MIAGKEINDFVNSYCRLRDRQTAVYDRCAKMHGLTVNELFVLDILWFAPNGCTQKEISDRLSSNKQTINAIINVLTSKVSFRIKRLKKTDAINVLSYANGIIPPAADAENLAMADMPIEKVAELVKLTTTFTENMERRFAEIKEN